MNIAIIYDTQTNTTAAAASYIKEGAETVSGVTAACCSIADADNDFVRNADGIIIGSPTYMASATYRMQKWLQTEAPRLGFAGKLGGAFATEQYIHGGAENVISTILTHEMCFSMMVYSGGAAFGKPVIHLGPVGMSQNISDFRDLFVIYGTRFAEQLLRVKG